MSCCHLVFMAWITFSSLSWNHKMLVWEVADAIRNIKVSLKSSYFLLRLRIAFKWMVRAFSGYLSTDQLLLLWDRILGYDSLEVVAGRYILNSYFHTNCALVFWRHFPILPVFYYAVLPSCPIMPSLSPCSSCGCGVCLPRWEPDGGDVAGLGWGLSAPLLDLCVRRCVSNEESISPVAYSQKARNSFRGASTLSSPAPPSTLTSTRRVLWHPCMCRRTSLFVLTTIFTASWV